MKLLDEMNETCNIILPMRDNIYPLLSHLETQEIQVGLNDRLMSPREYIRH